VLAGGDYYVSWFIFAVPHNKNVEENKKKTRRKQEENKHGRRS
jgi:hypothetical protein